MLPDKNPTAWRPINGKGYIVSPGQQDLTDNLGNFLVDNSGNAIVTNGTYMTGLNPTAWTETVAK